MSLLLRHLARYVAQKAAQDPETREKVIKAARGVAKEVQKIAEQDDRAYAAGRAFRRALNRLNSRK